METARATGAPFWVSHASLNLAMALCSSGAWDEALERCAEVSEAPADRPYAVLVRGRILAARPALAAPPPRWVKAPIPARTDARGHTEEAATLLELAREVYSELGADHWAAGLDVRSAAVPA